MHTLDAKRVDHFRDLTLSSFQDEWIGDVNGPGWFALFKDERVIYQEDSNGFRYASRADTLAELMEAWSQITEECSEYDREDDF